MTKRIYYLLFPILLVTSAAFAQSSPAANSLDDLLSSVKSKQQQERQLNIERERQFLLQKDRQKALLKQAKNDFYAAQKKNNPLLKKSTNNEKKIEQLRVKLQEEARDLGNIQSIYREFLGDFSASLKSSLVSAQLPDRQAQLKQLASSQQPATIQQFETLWLLIQQEMTEAGKLVNFSGSVVATDGSTEERNLLRVGPFTTFDGNAFLRYIPETGELLTLNRQPSQRYLNVAKRFSKGNGEQLPMVVDPTGGSLLGMLSYTPTLRERIEQGGTIGFIIIGLGLCGLLLTLWRIIYLGSVHLAIRRQLGKLKQPCPKNPLGRVIGSVGRLSDWQHEGEGLQFKLDEAILAELPRLERAHSFIKLLAATSPLLGLLGTVTGMILTFQAISLYGSGDPKLMATGISQALITTVLGLIVAIPLLFGHNLVNSLARNMIQRLDEQSAGIMARLTEEADADQ